MRSCADTSLTPTFTCLSTFPGCAGPQHRDWLAAGVWAVDTVRTTAVKPGWGPGQEAACGRSRRACGRGRRACGRGRKARQAGLSPLAPGPALPPPSSVTPSPPWPTNLLPIPPMFLPLRSDPLPTLIILVALSKPPAPVASTYLPGKWD